MLGAIIGDLAAETWKADKKVFYERLVAPEAKLTQYGVVAKAIYSVQCPPYKDCPPPTLIPLIP